VAEMFRWFDAAGGGGDYIDNETKFSPGWFRSFMGKEAYDCLAVAKSYTIDEWQDKLTAIIDDHKRRMTGSKKLPGPGRCIPTMFAIDSVMGKLKDETVEKIKSEGHGGKGYPVEALAITRYMQVASSWLDGWPFVMVLVNHLKEKNDDRGNAIRSTAGGKHLNFQETFELELARFGSRIDTETFEGFHVQIECMKNSLGGGSRRIQTRVIWWYEEDPLTGQLVQQSRWDWDWTTVKLLNGLLNGQKSSPLLRSRLKKIGFHLEVGKSGDAENSAWSKNLKMHSSGQATWNEVGAMIAQDERLTDRLRKALLIHRQPVLAGDYLAQRNELAGKAS
jgi:RecA/RadA recombinase